VTTRRRDLGPRLFWRHSSALPEHLHECPGLYHSPLGLKASDDHDRNLKVYIKQEKPAIKEATSRFSHFDKFSLNFSSSLFVAIHAYLVKNTKAKTDTT